MCLCIYILYMVYLYMIDKHSYIVLRFNILSLKKWYPGSVETLAQGHRQAFPTLEKVVRHVSTFTLEVQATISVLSPVGLCLQEQGLSAGPGRGPPRILTHKGPERWDCVCFGLVPITRIIKIHSRGTSTLSTVCLFWASLKNVNSRKAVWGRPVWLCPGQSGLAGINVGWLLSASHWHGRIPGLLCQWTLSFLAKKHGLI